MIIPVRKWLERIKFVLLFIVLTLLLFRLFSSLTAWMEPKLSYEEPKGNAVKVFGDNEYATKSDADLTFENRLKLFYWLGE